ncbi:MAG: glycosyl transferase, group 1 [Bryobacterales bacterium]|jgi:glycosyltransferase involved in cell wall biosynthesis/SAM-dependent methyltransferase|nr:glycosyl transferase, group 1 [Bryobacterales bacterium]
MRVAFFSPLPPAKSGIADYSAAVLEHLNKSIEVETFASKPAAFDPSRYDVCVYQLGNNPYHDFVYEAAMEHPGVVVMHEANLHHLVADLTINRNDWDGYVREVGRNHGPEAEEYAERYVRTRQRAPDYSLAMMRTVLARSRGAIVHSDVVAAELRAQGFEGPIARILHGAWTAPVDRMSYRARLGLQERTPLIGVFGFLKPYKRIAESLRAFRRLVRAVPDARMILVGEAHPELPLQSLIASMNLQLNVRHLDFVPLEDFSGYLGASDIVLNLRYPTVGESSGTLQRALGMGKAVIVSDVGSFRELPDDVCLKAPVGPTEEEHLFEYLNLLATRPSVRSALGDRARAWAEQECSWNVAAQRYTEFLEAVVEGREPAKAVAAAAQAGSSPVASPVGGDYIASWASAEDGSRSYVETHRTRLERTLALTPPGGPEDRILEMGAYLQITPALKTRLGYGEVRGCYYGPPGQTNHRRVTSENGEDFQCDVDLFDAEKDRFPYEDGYFSTVLCCELIEHLPSDPMHMMGEINRVLKPGGALVLTTPNIASARAVSAILQGFHPMLFPAYIRPNQEGETEARHNREYSPREIKDLLENSGFEVAALETGPFREELKPEHAWVEHLLDRYILPKEHRGDGIYAVGRKRRGVRDRYPSWLYS